jgi:preprotein translocase subunit SecF
MIRFFDKADYDFLGVRQRSIIMALAFMIPGLLLLGIRGVNQSIEFTGGTLIELTANSDAINTGEIRSVLEGAGIANPEITTFGAPNEFLIRARLDPRADVDEESTQATARAIDVALAGAFGDDGYEIVRTEAIGPKVGSELRQKAVLAILMGFGAIFIYLSIRMEWRFAIGAVTATIHDILSALAFLAFLDIEVTLAVATALLFIVGYSVNDTIVTFDRVRENLHKFKRRNLYEILNRSINETLPRTVLTSGTTIAATLAWVILGGEVLRGFAMVMTFGIVAGTFSSIFIASPVLLLVEQKWPGEDVRGARAYSGGPTVVESEDKGKATAAASKSRNKGRAEKRAKR